MQSLSLSDDLQGYVCPICLEIYETPVQIDCGRKHTYCRKCVEPYQKERKPHCPQCREVFNPNQLLLAADTDFLMRQAHAKCRWCSEEMTVFTLKQHLPYCSQQDTSIPQFKPVAETSQEVPSNLPNRATFTCPVCGMSNLDTTALVDHCNQEHKYETDRVCPICASMPWGDTTMRSSDFINHLNIRHKFEYDTFVDFNQDDDEMLQQALAASLQDH